jgi:ornithine cyclodeaminase/alanine dehydrogenase-like protein (mu-crystallin family)
MREIGVDDAARCVDVSDEVFRLLHAGDYLMGGPNRNSHGLGLVFPAASPFPNMPVAGPDRRFVSMPAYLGGRFDVCGNKWYGSNVANLPLGLPRSVLTVMLNDKATGEPLALMAANALSAARTGAVPAVATRYLLPREPRTLAVVGCGTINRAAVAAILSQQPGIRSVVCVNRSHDKAEAFAAWVRDDLGVAAEVAPDVRTAVANADLVTVAASRTAPLEVEADWFLPDAVIMLSGPMTADDALWTQSRIVYDHIALHEAYVADAHTAPDLQAAYRGTIGGPFYRLIDEGRLPALLDSEDLGTVMAEGRPADTTRRTVFIACGMAVFDVAWAAELLSVAEERGVGSVVDLWGN